MRVQKLHDKITPVFKAQLVMNGVKPNENMTSMVNKVGFENDRLIVSISNEIKTLVGDIKNAKPHVEVGVYKENSSSLNNNSFILINKFFESISNTNNEKAFNNSIIMCLCNACEFLVNIKKAALGELSDAVKMFEEMMPRIPADIRLHDYYEHLDTHLDILKYLKDRNIKLNDIVPDSRLVFFGDDYKLHDGIFLKGRPARNNGIADELIEESNTKPDIWTLFELKDKIYLNGKIYDRSEFMVRQLKKEKFI